jgi:hypothetical protein
MAQLRKKRKENVRTRGGGSVPLDLAREIEFLARIVFEDRTAMGGLPAEK